MRTEIIEILQKKYPEYCMQHIDTADEILRLFSVIVPFVCRDCDKPTKEYRDNLCEPCHKWHTDS